MKLLRFFRRRALLARGRDLMARWATIVRHFGGDVWVAEHCYRRLVVYRRAARLFAYRAGRLA